MSKRASLSEIMGKTGASVVQGGKKLSFDHLPEILGERMPEIPFDAIGEFRLTTALRNVWGDGFRNIPGYKDIMSDFRERRNLEERISEMKRIKYTRPSPKK